MTVGSISGTQNPFLNPQIDESMLHIKITDEMRAKMKDLSNYRVNVEIPGFNPSQVQDRYEGKTIVENKGFGGIRVFQRYTEDGKLIYTANDANQSAKAGAPTHGFFYQDTDFLMKAAEEYAKLGENEVFRYRNIDDGGFLQDALSFFTDGKYSSVNMYTIKDQMENAVLELAQQIKNGESPDVTKVQSKLTIDGVDFTLSQLLNFQKIGGELKENFGDITVGQLDISRYGKMGLAKSLADYYGSDKGEAGAMFSSAMNRMYDKGIALIEETAARPTYGIYGPTTSYYRGTTKAASTIRDIFASLDTSSKESITQDFSSKLGAVRTLVQEHCKQFNVSTAYIGLVPATADLMKYFNTLLAEM